MYKDSTCGSWNSSPPKLGDLAMMFQLYFAYIKRISELSNA